MYLVERNNKRAGGSDDRVDGHALDGTTGAHNHHALHEALDGESALDGGQKHSGGARLKLDRGYKEKVSFWEGRKEEVLQKKKKKKK